MANVLKVPPEKWLEEAREVLIKEGLGAVKANRLAKRLGVTRGGFYYHFESHQALLDCLVQDWASNNRMFPPVDQMESANDAVKFIEQMVANVILEERFSAEYEKAMREWARIDSSVREIVDQVDSTRIDDLVKVFLALGCDASEAKIRARVFYFHQMGYYALGYHKKQTREERLVNAPVYVRILCGRRYLEAAGDVARQWL